MELYVLGALSAHENGRSLDLGGRQQRLVLALLIMRVNEVVSLDRLLDEMWGEDVPATGRKAVQGYVSNLRKTLSADTIRTEPTGYRLIADRATIDAVAFEDAVNADRAETDRTEHLTNALAMWTGRPYEDLDETDALMPEIERLNELRLSASEEVIEIAIDQGRSREVIADIGRLAAAHPFRERTHALHITALYRASRQRDALQAYEELRQRLATEIGVEPSSALKQLEAQILAQDDSLNGNIVAPSTLRSANPYRGLRPFDERSGDAFFGREALVRRLLEHVGRPAAVRLTLVAGASGSGKSSVVRAGLVPSLEGDSRTTHTIVVGSESSWSDELANSSTDVIVLDQLESALTTPDEAAVVLSTIVANASRPDGPWIVATLRADFLDVLLADPSVGAFVEASLVLVPPMTDRELKEAIVEPANRVGVRVSEGLTQLLVSDMRNRSAGLPLLQYALTETYAASDTDELSVDDYQSVGGLGGALARRAEALLEPMHAERREVVRSSLLRLVTLGADGQPGLRTLPRGAFTDDQRDVLELFGAHRMVTFEGGDAPSVSVSHEALLREWPRLRVWIDEARDDLVALRRLSVAANEWNAEQRPATLLFSSALIARYDPQLESQATSTDLTFLAESRDSADQADRRGRRRRRVFAGALGIAALVAIGFAIVAQNDRRDANQQRELADEQRELANVQRELADEQRELADEQRRLADDQQRVAEQRALVSEALVQAQTHPELGLLLAAEAYAAEPTERSLRPMLSMLGRFPAEPVLIDDFTFDHGRATGVGAALSNRVGEFGNVTKVFNCAVDLEPGTFLSAEKFLSPVGRQVMTSLVNATTGEGRVFESPQGCRISVDSDQTRGLTDVFEGTTGVRSVIFDLRTGAVEAESSEITQAEWLPSGRILGFEPAAAEGTLRDRSESAQLIWADRSLTSFSPTGVSATAIYPDRLGSFIVGDQLVETNGTLDLDKVHRYVLDASDLSVVHDLGVVEATPSRVAWSPDSSLFGDVSGSGRMRVWGAISGQLIADRTLGSDTSGGAWLAFSPTNDEVALVLRSGEVTIRPVRDPSLVSFQVRRLNGPGVEEAAAASFIDRNTIAVLLADASVEVTNLRSTVLASSTLQRTDDLMLTPSRWSDTDGSVFGLTETIELIDLQDPTRRSPSLYATSGLPAIIGMSTAVQPNRVHVWSAELGSLNVPGLVQSVDVDTGSLASIGLPVEFELLAGTRLVVGLRDRIVTQNSGGTIFQFGYDGERLKSRVDLPFVGTAIAQSPISSLAIVAGSEQVAFVDLDSGEVFEQADANLGSPAAMVSDELAVIARLGGEIELWTTDGLESIGPLIPANARGRNDSLSVTSAGDLWYHTSTESHQITTAADAMAETACRLASRSLTEDEWRRHVSTERAFEPTC